MKTETEGTGSKIARLKTTLFKNGEFSQNKNKELPNNAYCVIYIVFCLIVLLMPVEVSILSQYKIFLRLAMIIHG